MVDFWLVLRLAIHKYLLNDHVQITGQSLFLGHFAAWSMQFALREGAIIVSPNYPKLPESTGLQLMDSISHFYEWVHDKLSTVVLSATEGHVEFDKTKMMVLGCSAGEYGVFTE